MTDKIEYSIPEIHFTETTNRSGSREFYAWCMVEGVILSYKQVVEASRWQTFGENPGFLLAMRQDIIHSLVDHLLRKELI